MSMHDTRTPQITSHHRITARRTRWSRRLCAGFGLTALCAAPAIADIDPGFGHNGVALSDLDPARYSVDRADDILVQPDGRMVLVGTGESGGSSDIVVLRLMEDGSRDPSFGAQVPGEAIFDFAPGGQRRDVGTAVGQQSSGRIIVAGYMDYAADDADCIVLGLRSDGSLDPTFAAGGKAHIWFDQGGTNADVCHDLAIMDDDRIVVTGAAETGQGTDAAVFMLTADGLLDAGFGRRFVDIDGSDEARAVLTEPGPQPSDPDRIVIAGSTGQADRDVFAARFMADGQLDAGFAGGVSRIPGLSGRPDELGDVMRQSNGRYVLALRSEFAPGDWDLMAIGLSSDGTLDPSFASGGRIHIPLDEGGPEEGADAIIALPNGSLIVAGYADGNDRRFASAVQLTRNGKRYDRLLGHEFHLEFDDTGAQPSNQAFLAMAYQPGRGLLLAGEGTRTNPYGIDMAVTRVRLFDVETKWQWSGLPIDEQVMTTPIVGNLTDDNGDGAVDHHDTPDVVFTTYHDRAFAAAGRLRVLDGGHGTPLWSRDTVLADPIAGSGGVAIADANGDEWAEVYVQSVSGALLAVEGHAGGELWRCSAGPQGPAALPYSSPSIAHLDGAVPGIATVGILLGGVICDAAMQAQQPGGQSLVQHRQPVVETVMPTGRAAFLADVDGVPGPPEIVSDSGVAEADGTPRWSIPCSVDGACPGMGYAAVGQLDPTTAALEVVAVFDGEVGVFAENPVLTVGDALWRQALGGPGAGGPPTIADLDGDGHPEIGVATADRFEVFDRHGTFIWSAAIRDTSSGGAAAISSDIDGDGRMEVLLADEHDLWIFDGPTGEVVLRIEAHGSRTLIEYPVVADVDGDGAQEIILASNGGDWDGITVLESAGSPWAAGRPVWNQYGYRACAVHDNLSVPQHPACGPNPADHRFR